MCGEVFIDEDISPFQSSAYLVDFLSGVIWSKLEDVMIQRGLDLSLSQFLGVMLQLRSMCDGSSTVQPVSNGTDDLIS